MNLLAPRSPLGGRVRAAAGRAREAHGERQKLGPRDFLISDGVSAVASANIHGMIGVRSNSRLSRKVVRRTDRNDAERYAVSVEAVHDSVDDGGDMFGRHAAR